MSDEACIEDEGQRSIIMGIIDQLRKGTDLHRVSLPTFVLEPRSMCERLRDFFSFQYILEEASKVSDPAERLLQVVRYFLSGWHIRPKGVKKPFNPILGEFFRCEWIEQDQTKSYYLCEQVSHHPPISAFVYCNPSTGTFIYGELRPKGKFFGNSAGTMMEGGSVIHMKNDTFSVTNPNIYARSILFGTMFMELGDSCEISSLDTDHSCTLEYKQKGFFSGSDKDNVSGKLKDGNGSVIYKISGKWSGKTVAADDDGKEHVLFDKPQYPPPKLIIADESTQEEFESQKLWRSVASAVKKGDHKTATVEKEKIEDNQRLLSKHRLENDIPWEARFFKFHDGNWLPLIVDTIYKNRKKGDPIDDSLVQEYIYSKPVKDIHLKFWL